MILVLFIAHGIVADIKHVARLSFNVFWQIVLTVVLRLDIFILSRRELLF